MISPLRSLEERKATVKKLRLLLGMSQEALAQKLDISLRTVQRYERENKLPALTVAQYRWVVQELEARSMTLDDLGDFPSPGGHPSPLSQPLANAL